MMNDKMNQTTLTDDTTLTEICYAMAEGDTCFSISPKLLRELFLSRTRN